MPRLQSKSVQSRATTKLSFPERWYEEADRPLDFIQQLEVRKLSSSPGGEFFFAALPNGDNDYAHEWSKETSKPVYSENSYAATFTPTPRVRAATKQEWESATRIVTGSRLLSSNGPDLSSGEIEYRGKKFRKSGKYWQSGLLSPGGKWLAIFSYTGERQQDLFLDGGSVRNGDIFWDVYDTASGEKVFEWRATNVKSPTDRSGPVVWLEERYFLFPEDLDAQNFIVVTLPDFVPEKNPITFVLPSRTGAAQRAPELIETRSPRDAASRELLIAIREETERVTRHQAAKGMEPARDYNYRGSNTYYYAISLDDPTQNRLASKEEWESAGIRQSRRLPAEAEKAHQQFRPFPKLGEISGGSFYSSIGNWTAVFSYTPNAAAKTSGKMFVEVFETRPGNKFSSTEFPYNGSAEALFKSALWVEGDYLLVPLNTSLDSFALWNMPGAR
jgi:hypothetical protein